MSLATVLCVDDDEVGLLVRKMTLEAAGFRVSIATCGKAGLELLAASQFDLVVLDHSMPEMNGGEVAEQIRVRYPGFRLCCFRPRLPSRRKTSGEWTRISLRVTRPKLC